jgi:hypothetical protein
MANSASTNGGQSEGEQKGDHVEENVVDTASPNHGDLTVNPERIAHILGYRITHVELLILY